MISVVQQVDRESNRARPGTLVAVELKEWNPTKPGRRPLSPQEGLKLRDVDVVLIPDRCKGCSYCIEFCPREVFQEGRELNKIGIHPPRIRDSSLCVGCGLCEEICPDFAVFLVDKNPTRRTEL